MQSSGCWGVGGGRKGDPGPRGDRASVGEEEKVLEIGDAGGCPTMEIH